MQRLFISLIGLRVNPCTLEKNDNSAFSLQAVQPFSFFMPLETVQGWSLTVKEDSNKISLSAILGVYCASAKSNSTSTAK
jgi:hypothetical protein